MILLYEAKDLLPIARDQIYLQLKHIEKELDIRLSILIKYWVWPNGNPSVLIIHLSCTIELWNSHVALSSTIISSTVGTTWNNTNSMAVKHFMRCKYEFIRCR